jgi:hypothetical protein
MRSALDYVGTTSGDKLNRRVLSLCCGIMAFARAEMLAAPSKPAHLDEVEGMTKQGHGLYIRRSSGRRSCNRFPTTVARVPWTAYIRISDGKGLGPSAILRNFQKGRLAHSAIYSRVCRKSMTCSPRSSAVQPDGSPWRTIVHP